MNELSYKEKKDIVLGKLVDKTIDDDYEDLSEKLFGEGNCFNSSEVRKRMYGMKTIIEDIEKEKTSLMGNDILSELDQKRIELQKEKQKFFDQRAAFNKVIRERSREEELNEIIIDAVKHGDLPMLDYVERQSNYGSDNDLIVSLNDIHYGAVVDNYWCKYNSTICKDMMRRYLDKIIEISKLHKSENCYVTCNGDMISGNIHYSVAVTNKENVIEQIIGVSELISEFLAELSKHFNKVYFVSIAGNHSKINPNKDNTLPGERLDDLIGWYVKARLQNFDNIEIADYAKIDDTIYLIDIRGKTYCGVHGDYDGSAAKVQALQTMSGRPLYAVLSGHLHHNEIGTVQGIKTVMAGSFLGMDSFCIEKRIFGRPEQMVCVCDDSGIKCYYDVSF